MELVRRVFAAVPIPGEARLDLAHQLHGLDIPGRLAPTENWHLTLRFLGAIDETTFEKFLHGLSRRDLPDAFALSLKGLGGFPNQRRASVVWVGVESGLEQLEMLNELTEEAAQEAGLGAEERPYRPHLTISRVRPPRSITHLEGEQVRVGYRADRLVVYQSHLGRGGARYEAIEEFGFG